MVTATIDRSPLVRPASRPRPALLAAAAVGALVAVAGIILAGQHWMRGDPWTPRTVLLVGGRCAAGLLGLVVGCLWWWRAPANPTGKLLFLAAIGDWVWIVSYNWLEPVWVGEFEAAWCVVLPCLALVVLGWPTGRPPRRIRNVVLLVSAAAFLVSLISSVLHKSAEPSPRWPDLPHQLFAIPIAYEILDAVQALCFGAIPSVAVIIVLVRRRRAVPPAIRSSITPITVAGILVAAGLVLQHGGLQLFDSLLPSDEHDVSVPRFVLLAGPYWAVGIVAVGVLVGGGRRRRAISVGARELVVDLESAAPIVSPAAAVAPVLGDPTATIRYRTPGGKWVDRSGAPMEPSDPGRQQLAVLDDRGEVTAAVELSAATVVPPLLSDLVTDILAARASNERAAALADARRLEVLAGSRELVAATDRSRLNLERDLHDGAQQLLVGLALTAGLAVRAAEQTGASESSDTTTALLGQIADVRREILALIDAGAPAALSGGLAAALRTLAAVCPVPATVSVQGDLDGGDPAASNLYLAAADAIGNAVKHAGAGRIGVRLTVHTDRATITVTDDGRGGVAGVPGSLADRAAQCGGDVRIDSPAGVGTIVTLNAPRWGDRQ